MPDHVGSNDHNHIRYANLWIRIAALAVDLGVFCAVFFPITRLVKGTWLMTSSDHMWSYGWFITDPICLTFLGIIFVYFVVLEGTFGVTVGKRVVGIKVVDLSGGRPGLQKSFVRNILRLVDALPVMSILRAVLILPSLERTRVGDRVAKTRVVHW